MSSSQEEDSGRHDPTDVEVSGPRWKLNFDPESKTANFRLPQNGVLVASFTEAQYCQVRRDFQNLEKFASTDEAKATLESTTFEDVNGNFKDLVSTPVAVPDSPRKARTTIKVQLLANVS